MPRRKPLSTRTGIRPLTASSISGSAWLPVDPNPVYYGYSVGRWEGDTLVVDTAGFKEGSWLDNDGHSHTDALHTTERYRRTNFGSMEMVVTIDDPKAHSRPWTAQQMHFGLRADTEILEHLCENNRDLERLLEIWKGGGPAPYCPASTGPCGVVSGFSRTIRPRAESRETEENL